MGEFSSVKPKELECRPQKGVKSRTAPECINLIKARDPSVCVEQTKLKLFKRKYQGTVLWLPWHPHASHPHALLQCNL